jgi:hypothetical protein
VSGRRCTRDKAPVQGQRRPQRRLGRHGDGNRADATPSPAYPSDELKTTGTRLLAGPARDAQVDSSLSLESHVASSAREVGEQLAHPAVGAPGGTAVLTRTASGDFAVLAAPGRDRLSRSPHAVAVP